MSEERVERITVVGLGTMGHGIAQVAAAAGVHVDLYDAAQDAVGRARGAIEANLDKGIARGKVTEEEKSKTLSNLHPASDLELSAARADLIVEAVPELLDLKRDLFVRLDAAANDHTILATNTSSLPVGELAESTSRPDRVVGMHFFNPVHIMALVELIRADATSEETLRRTVELGQRMGKEPIVVRDSPGFATSRLGVALGLEAIRMVEQEVASPEDIDKAMTLGYRHPMGPLRLTDLVGLDVRLAIADHLHRELESEAFRPPELLRRLVSEGKLGKKTGQGFYDWSEK